jgi:hypothetical protein
MSRLRQLGVLDGAAKAQDSDDFAISIANGNHGYADANSARNRHQVQIVFTNPTRASGLNALGKSRMILRAYKSQEFAWTKAFNDIFQAKENAKLARPTETIGSQIPLPCARFKRRVALVWRAIWCWRRDNFTRWFAL